MLGLFDNLGLGIGGNIFDPGTITGLAQGTTTGATGLFIYTAKTPKFTMAFRTFIDSV